MHVIYITRLIQSPLKSTGSLLLNSVGSDSEFEGFPHTAYASISNAIPRQGCFLGSDNSTAFVGPVVDSGFFAATVTRELLSVPVAIEICSEANASPLGAGPMPPIKTQGLLEAVEEPAEM